MAERPASKRGATGAAGDTGKTGRTGAAGKTGTTGRTGAVGRQGRPGKDAVTPDEYLQRADKLQRSLDGLRKEIATQNTVIATVDRNAKQGRRTARVALAGVILALLGLLGLWQQNGRIIAARTEARNTQCLRDNEVRHDAGEAGAKKAQDFIDANRKYYKSPPATGALKQAELDYVNSQRAVTLDAYPRRDCTADGVDAYYENPPKARVEPCKPDGRGLCKP